MDFGASAAGRLVFRAAYHESNGEEVYPSCFFTILYELVRSCTILPIKGEIKGE